MGLAQERILARRPETRRWALVLVLAVLALGCKEQGGKGGGEGAGAIGALGKALAQGPSADLRLSPDGRFAAFLMDPEKPRLSGVPPQMVLGALEVAPVAGGARRKLGNGVTNLPGGYLFSPDSRWLFFLSGYNAAEQQGRLEVADLADPDGKPQVLGDAVTYMLANGDSKWLAFVDGGVLKVGPPGQGPYVEVAGEVATVQFSPDGTFLLFKRRLGAAGGLFRVPVGKWDASRKLADQVGDYAISPDSGRVAFSQRSPRGTFDLYLVPSADAKPVQVASGSAAFAFSPDSKWLARIEGQRPELLGELFVGPADGGAARKLGEKINEFAFAPDSSAIAYLEEYDQSARAGKMGVTQLPDGKPRQVGIRVPNFIWGADGRYVAFLSRFFKPVYSVDLMLYPVGQEQALKAQQGVFGYGFTPAKDDRLLFRTACIRNGRACDLYALELAKPTEPPKKLIEGIYSFKTPEKGGRVMVTYARIDADTYDVAVYNLASGVRKTLERGIQLPAYFAAEDGSKVAYIVSEKARAGVYVADQVP